MVLHVDDLLYLLHKWPTTRLFLLPDRPIHLPSTTQRNDNHPRQSHSTQILIVDVDGLYWTTAPSAAPLELLHRRQVLVSLLGIDVKPNRNERADHALTELCLRDCREPTFKSGRRILQECGRLGTLSLRICRMAASELFQGNDKWSCSNTLLTLDLHVLPRRSWRRRTCGRWMTRIRSLFRLWSRNRCETD